jgi:hypothetical protein
MEQQERVASALLSPLMGQNEQAFPAPTPPAFGEGYHAGLSTSARSGGAPSSAASLTFSPLPPAGAQLLETEQMGKTTSALLSGLTGPSQAGSPFGGSTFAQPTTGTGSASSLFAMRAAEEVLQAVETTSSSLLNARIANDAYQMELQAQQEHMKVAAGTEQGNWEWFA